MYQLASALPVIRTNVTIFGDGPDATVISGACTTNSRNRQDGSCSADKFRVLENSGTLALYNLTIRGGSDHYAGGGGGLLNRGRMGLEHVTVTANHSDTGAGGIANVGSGYLTISNSTVSENFSNGLAGGIVNESSARVDVSNSTISDNRTFPFSGVRAGGILNMGLLAMTASTISRNVSWDGQQSASGLLNLGESWLNNVTIAANTGAVAILTSNGEPPAGSKLYVGNSIIAGNERGDCAGGQFSTLRGNLIGKATCAIKDWTGLAGLGGKPPADIIGEREGYPLSWNVFVSPDARWGGNTGTPLLANNGGPTCTHALCPLGGCVSPNVGSLARNKGWQNTTSGGFACSSNDQRGVARNSCDSGAFEWVLANPTPRPELSCSTTLTLVP